MRSDVHFAALKAAARVAFSMSVPVVLLNGCASALEPAETAESGITSDDELAASGSKRGEANEGKDTPSSSSRADAGAEEPDACAKADSAPPKQSCDATLAAAYPTPGDYQWEPVAQSSDVVACCDEELGKTNGMSQYRWDCCVAYDPAQSSDAGPNTLHAKHGMACTPWGPPVPPSMHRVRRARPEVDVWLARAVA